MPPPTLAVFDLDHTLIPFDSGSVFTSFLIARGVLAPSFEADYLAYCREYAAGRVDMVQMHRFTVSALAHHEPARLDAWLDEFRDREAAPRIPEASKALLRKHRDAGHRCILATATSRIVARPFSEALGEAIGGFDAVLATEPARDASGRVTGEVVGVPCFREDKLTHLNAWRAANGLAAPGAIDRLWFHSDSINDLALLQAASDPVVVDPDPMLAKIAAERGWPSISLR